MIVDDMLTADDWDTLNQYLEVLEPLKQATERLQGRAIKGIFYSLIFCYNIMLRSGPCFAQGHASLGAMLRSGPFFAPGPCFARGHASLRAMLRLGSCFARAHASLRAMLRSGPCFAQGHASLKAVLRLGLCFA
jgi:hypothetical protein